MPFPVSIRGQFAVTRPAGQGDITSLLLSEAQDLLSTRSDDVEVIGHSVISRPSFLAWFTAPGSNWHPMVPFDQVKLTITGTGAAAVVSYDLSTRRMLRIAGLMSLSVAIFVEVTSFGHEGPVAALGTALKFAVGAFAWLFGTNFLSGWARGPRWLRAKLLM